MVQCPHCSYQAKLPPQWAGQESLRCPKCRREFAISVTVETEVPGRETDPPLPPVVVKGSGDEATGSGGGASALSYIERRFGNPIDVVFGRGMRLILALVVVAGFAMWRYDNREALTQQLQEVNAKDADRLALNPKKEVPTTRIFDAAADSSRPLRVAMLPDWYCDTTGCWNGGVAAAILLASLTFYSRFIGGVMYVAAGIVLFGYHLSFLQDIPRIAPTSIAMAAGLVIAVLTFMLAKRHS